MVPSCGVQEPREGTVADVVYVTQTDKRHADMIQIFEHGHKVTEIASESIQPRRCAEVAGRPVTSTPEVFPWADFEGGRNAT